MAARCSYSSIVTAVETLDTNVEGANSPRITWNAFDTELTLSADSTPVVSEVAYLELALSAGAKTIDLTALVTAVGTVNGTGLKVQMIKFINPTGNAAMTFKAGASNGYNIGSHADWEAKLGPLDEVIYLTRESSPDISGSAKNIDVTGTLAQEFQVVIWMG